ncbi:MAG: hypothetical protein HONDAALG_02631 [Gammaproteobacteria bacterium]|nr:hypothetical protein [Gammaproteobacteria bacterium]
MKNVFTGAGLLFVIIAVIASSDRVEPVLLAKSEIEVASLEHPALNTAMAFKSDPATEMRAIQFSGYEWRVKSSDKRVGPGPNYFSDGEENVAVDDQGRLHMRITQRDGRWYCAEVISQRNFGYGTYRFYVETNVDQMDPKVILGLFTWSDAPEYNHREIDIEISRWGKSENKNGQFVVQPYTRSQNIVRFQIPIGLGTTTHSFTWKAESIFCQSLKGLSSVPPEPDTVIHEHTFTRGIPRAGDENARINLWLLGGRPADGKETEIIISKFEFLPPP